jgi:hypothetical protein
LQESKEGKGGKENKTVKTDVSKKTVPEEKKEFKAEQDARNKVEKEKGQIAMPADKK